VVIRSRIRIPESGLLSHSSYDWGIGHFRRFISISNTVDRPLFTKLGEMTDADNVINPQHFGRHRIWIRMNLEICIRIPDHSCLRLRPVYSDTTQISWTQLNSTQLDVEYYCRHVHSVNNCHLSVTQLTQFVGHDVVNKNIHDLAVRCSTGSVEFSWVQLSWISWVVSL